MEKGNVKRHLFNVLKSVLFSLIISVLLILVVAIVAKYTDISETGIMICNQVIKVVSLLFGILIGFKGQKGGIIIGAIVGLLFTLLSFAVFSLISGSLEFSNVTVYDFLIGVGTGAVSGILTVNLKGLKKQRHKTA